MFCLAKLPSRTTKGANPDTAPSSEKDHVHNSKKREFWFASVASTDIGNETRVGSDTTTAISTEQHSEDGGKAPSAEKIAVVEVHDAV